MDAKTSPRKKSQEKPKETPKEEPIPSLPTIKATMAKIEERMKSLEGKVEDCVKNLPKLKQTMLKNEGKGKVYELSKKKALFTLRRKKMYETQIETLEIQLFNLEQMEFKHESIQDTLETESIIREAGLLQKKITEENALKLEKIEEIEDDIAEALNEQQEIQDILCRDYAINSFDEFEIEEELGELDEEIVNEKLDEASVPFYLQNLRDDGLNDLDIGPELEEEFKNLEHS